MRLPRKFLRFDYGVHILFGVLALISAVLIPLSGGKTFWLLILLWPLLGFWQVSSALILTLRYKNKLRAYYLIAVAIYGVVFFAFVSVNKDAIPLIFLSLLFAVWYGVLTYKDATYRTPSFWDLEF